MIVGSRHWLLVLLVWVVAITTWPRTASAQTTLAMSKDYPVVREHDDTGRNVGSSTDQTIAQTITAADCRSSRLTFKFSLAVTGYDTTQTLQAWAGRGGDCSAEATASSQVTRSCWRLESRIEVVNGVATVEISPSKLLGLNIDETFAGTQRILREGCDDPVTGTGQQAFTVHFVLINNENKVASSATQKLYYALNGPDAPDINQLISADQSLLLKWTALTGTAAEHNYEFYCAVNEAVDGGCKSSKLEAFGSPGPASSGGSKGLGGAGGDTSTKDTGGTEGTMGPLEWAGTAGATGDTSSGYGGGGGNSSVSEDVSTAGIAGTPSKNIPPELACGKKNGKMNSSGIAEFEKSAMINGQSYAVALGVRDAFGNLGKLSSYRCEKPRDVVTFFEAYRLGGGEAGGGFCNLSAVPKRTSIPVTLGLLGACSWLRRRTRRRRIRLASTQAND